MSRGRTRTILAARRNSEEKWQSAGLPTKFGLGLSCLARKAWLMSALVTIVEIVGGFVGFGLRFWMNLMYSGQFVVANQAYRHQVRWNGWYECVYGGGYGKWDSIHNWVARVELVRGARGKSRQNRWNLGCFYNFPRHVHYFGRFDENFGKNHEFGSRSVVKWPKMYELRSNLLGCVVFGPRGGSRGAVLALKRWFWMGGNRGYWDFGYGGGGGGGGRSSGSGW